MIEEVEAEHVEQAIMLTQNYTDNEWFQAAANVADAICFTAGRIKFESPSGEKAAPTQGQAFMYFGHNVSKFASIFADVGLVYPALLNKAAKFTVVNKWQTGGDLTDWYRRVSRHVALKDEAQPMFKWREAA